MAVELWVPITLLAAFSQNIRSALQKKLTAVLSTVGAVQSRFFYALPFCVCYVLMLLYIKDFSFPVFNVRFASYALLGGAAQIVATVFLVKLFSYRNFFIGAAFTKTETIQTALLGFIVLSDGLSIGAVVGISIGVLGVMIFANTRNDVTLAILLKSLRSKPAIIGILSGLFFAIASVCFRGASLSLSGGYMIQAAVTLLVVLTFQSVAITLYLLRVEPKQMTAVIRHWRVASLVGLAGMVASACWFTAMTLENASHVKAVGQVELIFAFFFSVIIFKEKASKMEITGVLMTALGIIVLLFYK